VRLADRATPKKPHLTATGVRAVSVNGVVVYRGTVTGVSGAGDSAAIKQVPRSRVFASLVVRCFFEPRKRREIGK